jgi:hypothetical protein
MRSRPGAGRRGRRGRLPVRSTPFAGPRRVAASVAAPIRGAIAGSLARSSTAAAAVLARSSTAAAGGLARSSTAIACALVAVLVVSGAAPAAAASPDSVFHIDRNKNRNQVHYGVHVDDRCQPVGEEPVYNYWLRREEDPPVVRPLKYIQQAAYGFQKQTIESDGRIEVRLRALPDRQLVVRVASVGGRCKAETFMTSAGTQAYLDKVFVFAEEGIFLPTVRYIELFGRSNDGLAVYEKITVDE